MAVGDVVQSSRAAVGGGLTVTMADPPTPGNTVVLSVCYRNISGFTIDITVDGFTPLVDRIDLPEEKRFSLRGWLRHVQPGDSATITVSAGSAGTVVMWVEYEGVLTVDPPTDSIYDAGDHPAGSLVLDCGTVDVPAEGLAVGSTVCGVNVGDVVSWVAAGSSVELADFYDGVCPSTWLGEVRAPGSVTVQGEATHAGIMREYGGWAVALAFEEEEPPPTEPGTDIDIFDPEFVFMDTIDDAKKKEIRVELQGTGQGKVWLRRDSPNADTDLIRRGNWVKVTIPQIWDQPIFLFRIETIETTVIDRDESGGEEICFGGRGALVYFENYVAWNESFVVPAGKDNNGGVLHGPASTGNKAGQILMRMIEEGQHEDRGVSDFGHRHQPLALLTTDITYDDDSDGNTWNVTDMTEELSQGYVGDTGLSGIMELLATDEIDITIEPWQDSSSIPMRAYNSYGRDLAGEDFATDVVRFVRAVNIADRLKSSQGTTVDPNVMLVQGQENVYGYAENHGDDDQIVEGFASTFGTDSGALEAIGLAEIARRIRVGQSVAFRVTVPMAGHDPEPLTGLYLPGPEGSDGHYWIGDTVTLDTGTGYGDFDNTSVRVMAITITHTQADDLIVIPEVKGTLLTGRLRPTTGSVGTRSSTGTATGGTGPPAPPPAGAIATGHMSDPTDAHDASAISFDPTGLTNTDADDVQEAIEDLDAAIGTSDGGGFDVTPALSNAMPPWVKPTGTGVITADPQGRVNVDTGVNYKAFPSMCFLEGRLHLVYRDGTNHNSAGGVIKHRYSNDLGRTWSSATTIATPGGSLDFRDPVIAALSSGRLLVCYYDASSGGSVAEDPYTIYSDNRGSTWSAPVVVTHTFSGEAAGSSVPLELPNGTILLGGYGKSGGNWFSVVWSSTDGGATFGDQVTVAQDGTLDFTELTIRQMASGTLVALVREEDTGDTYRVTSTDLGATWSSETMVIDNSSVGRPDFVEFYPGALLWFGRGTSFASRWAVSWDEGATWTALQETDSGETANAEYHAPVVLAPGYVAVAYSIENSSTDADLYIRWYYDGYGTDPLGQLRASGLFLNGAEFDDTDPDDGEVWTYDSGTGKYVLETPVATVTAASLEAHGVVGELVIQDIPAGAPLVFADIVQNEAEDALVYADLYD